MPNEPLEIFLDFSALDSLNGVVEGLEGEIEQAVSDLTAAAHAHIVELAMQKLHSLQHTFLESLPPPQQIERGIWMITIPEKIAWIEDGLGAFDMLPGLLASPKAKEGKNGKFIVVPFHHEKKQSQQTPLQRTLSKAILTEMNKRGISKTGIERNPDGSPKLGTLHRFDVEVKQKNQVHPPFMGPAGQHFQTKPRSPGTEGPGGRPYTWGVQVKQRINPESQKAERNVMTFRTASAKQSGNMWKHPGISGLNSLDSAYRFVEDSFENKILPELLKKHGLA
jgi:hypothetical protein